MSILLDVKGSLTIQHGARMETKAAAVNPEEYGFRNQALKAKPNRENIPFGLLNL